MSDIVFKSIDSLKSYLKNAINLALEETVSKNIVDCLEVNAAEVVYPSYTPHTYDHAIGDRRYSLLDDKNYQIDVKGDMSLTVTPVAEFNPLVWHYWKDKKTKSKHWYSRLSRNEGDELAGLINYGNGWNGYEYDFAEDKDEYTDPDDGEDMRAYSQPRPFIDITKKNLADGLLKESLEIGLKKYGINASN